MRKLLPLVAVALLAAPALAAPTVKARPLPTHVQTFKVDSFDPAGGRSLKTSTTRSVTTDPKLLSVIMPAFNVAETLEHGRIEPVRTIDILKDVSAEKIAADVAFDGASSRKESDAIAGQESLNLTPLSRSRSAVKEAGKTVPPAGKAALLTGIFSVLPIALHAGGASQMFEIWATVALVALGLTALLGLAFATDDSSPAWFEDRRLEGFVGKIIKNSPGVAEMRLGREYPFKKGEKGHEYLDVYFESQEAMGKADVPGRFIAGPHYPRDIRVNKYVLNPGTEGRGKKIWGKAQ